MLVQDRDLIRIYQDDNGGCHIQLKADVGKLIIKFGGDGAHKDNFSIDDYLTVLNTADL